MNHDRKSTKYVFPYTLCCTIGYMYVEAIVYPINDSGRPTFSELTNDEIIATLQLFDVGRKISAKIVRIRSS